MNLTARSYVVAAAVTLLGIVGQWQDDPWPDLWRVPAASLLIGLLLEGIAARRRGLRISPGVPERVMLGQPAIAELVLGNDGERSLRVELQQVFANGLSGGDSIAAYTVPAHGAETGHAQLAAGLHPHTRHVRTGVVVPQVRHRAPSESRAGAAARC
jgi:hypothetical protein